uniref:SCY1-like protein 2 n=1 Tax=Diabrotica virgifera virgifera TaxID=50390 RepID=A0A6P7FXR5_DIAVI
MTSTHGGGEEVTLRSLIGALFFGADLDSIPPETQTQSVCSILSDMYSLGMVICSIFNNGRSLIQANNSTSAYLKQIELLDDQVHNLIPRIPVPIQEAASRLVSKDPRQRPTAQLLTLIKYFSDPALHALQFLDVINMKDPTQKSHFYRIALKDALPYIPKKMWYQTVWPCLQQEMRTQEVLAAVLQSVVYFVQEATADEYESIILPSLRNVFAAPKTVQATVTLLESLHIILEKTPREEIRAEILPLLYNAFDSTTIQVQSAALLAVTNVAEFLDDNAIKKMILPKTKAIYEKNQTDSKLISNVLCCVERILDRLDKTQIIDEVLPLLYDIRLSDPQITLRVVRKYNLYSFDFDAKISKTKRELLVITGDTHGGVLGSWWFGGSPSSPDSNFLRVVNAFPNRRLSDNTLMTPKIRVAPSCASSPGGTPGGGLPIRRHSSIGPQERRGSTVNLSPPTGGSMPNTSSSVPFLLSSSMQSIRSRRPSAVLGGSQGSQGLLQQLGSGMVRLTSSSQQPINSRTMSSSSVRKCPSLNITFS